MKYKIVTVVFLFITLSNTKSQTAAKWHSLFNGKDLTGWKQLNGKAKYRVQKGEIVGTAVFGEPNSFLATEKDYGDFVLEFEFKVDSTINSGVQFRSQSNAEYRNGRVHGYQYEIDPSNTKWTAGIYDEAGRDWLYTMDLNHSVKKLFKQNQWNKARIECIGNSIRTWLNNIPASYLVDDMTAKGFIALQVHSIGNKNEEGKQVRWRNIRIQTENIKAAAYSNQFVVDLIPNNLADAEKQNGVSLLWDGKTTNGWREAYENRFPEKGWEIKDGVLSVLASDGGESRNGDIVTTSEYSAFVLQFEFKLSDGANSGIKYFVDEKDRDTVKASAIGLEYQLLDDEKHPDAKLGVVGNRTLASLYDLIPSLKEAWARKPIGEWNRGILIVYPDNHVEHWLNGCKLLEYQRGAPYFYALVARSKHARWPNFGMAAKGHILLQDHGNLVSFRSIKIQELK